MSMNKALADRRSELDLTQEALARKAGLSVFTVSSIETGTSPKPHYRTKYKLAKALECDIEDLFGPHDNGKRGSA